MAKIRPSDSDYRKLYIDTGTMELRLKADNKCDLLTPPSPPFISCDAQQVSREAGMQATGCRICPQFHDEGDMIIHLLLTDKHLDPMGSST